MGQRRLQRRDPYHQPYHMSFPPSLLRRRRFFPSLFLG
jgi:hypothetical protein